MVQFATGHAEWVCDGGGFELLAQSALVIPGFGVGFDEFPPDDGTFLFVGGGEFENLVAQLAWYALQCRLCRTCRSHGGRRVECGGLELLAGAFNMLGVGLLFKSL